MSTISFHGTGIEARVQLEKHLALVRKQLNAGTARSDGDYAALVQTEVLLVDTLRRWERDAELETQLKEMAEPVRLSDEGELTRLHQELERMQREMRRANERLGEECRARQAAEERRVDDAVDALNSMLVADPAAMQNLLGYRVPCNEALANHPTCQVGGELEHRFVRMLGIINGIFGKDERGWGYIAANLDDGKLVRFQRTPQASSGVGPASEDVQCLDATRYVPRPIWAEVSAGGITWRATLHVDRRQPSPEGMRPGWFDAVVTSEETHSQARQGSAQWNQHGMRLHVVDLPSDARRQLEQALQRQLESEQMPGPPLGPRFFELHRDEDETGISGTGVVAQGVIFDSGKVALSWLTEHTSVAVYDSIRDVERIHGHGGKTRVVMGGSHA
jgi:hypothetical protein